MAQLKDLLVNGSARFIGDVYFNKLPKHNGEELALNRSISYTTGDGLSGSGSINLNDATRQISISHAAKPSATASNGVTYTSVGSTSTNTADSGTTTSRTYISKIDIDKHGHIAKVYTNTESDQTGLKTTQGAVSDPTAKGNAMTFIDTISQDTNGVITVTKKNVDADEIAKITVNNAVNASTADEASKVTNSLKFGTKTYNGSAEEEITAADLGLGSALRFIGTTTTAITNLGTTPTKIKIGNEEKTVAQGDIAIYSTKEFVWNGTCWEELGDEGSYVPNTRTIIAGSGLSVDTTSNGVLSKDVTISIDDGGVTTVKIAKENVTAEKLAKNAVTTEKIAAKNVTLAKLSDGVQTSLGKADSAVQSVSLASGTNNGTVKLTVGSTITDNIAVKGLQSAAYKIADENGNRSSGNVVTAKAAGQINSEKYTMTVGSSEKATMKYDNTYKCIRFTFNA